METSSDVAARIAGYNRWLAALLSANPWPFDARLRGRLPETAGVYRIFRTDSDWQHSVYYEVRLYIFRQAAETAHVPQPPDIAEALGRPEAEVRQALKHLAAGKVLILAPNDGNIWAANPFCAVPSGFRVETGGKTHWGICIWDALGIPAALGRDAVIRAPCGDCGDALMLEVRSGSLAHSEGVIHFAIPAHHWWDNIGFT